MYKEESFKYLEQAFQFANTQCYQSLSVTEASPGSLKSTKIPRCELFYELKEIHVFGYPDSPIVVGNGFSDSVYKTFDSLWKNKK